MKILYVFTLSMIGSSMQCMDHAKDSSPFLEVVYNHAHSEQADAQLLQVNVLLEIAASYASVHNNDEEIETLQRLQQNPKVLLNLMFGALASFDFIRYVVHDVQNRALTAALVGCGSAIPQDCIPFIASIFPDRLLQACLYPQQFNDLTQGVNFSDDEFSDAFRLALSRRDILSVKNIHYLRARDFGEMTPAMVAEILIDTAEDFGSEALAEFINLQSFLLIKNVRSHLASHILRHDDRNYELRRALAYIDKIIPISDTESIVKTILGQQSPTLYFSLLPELLRNILAQIVYHSH